MAGAIPDPFPDWIDALERRHGSALTFAEVRRALQALSTLYVERRSRLGGTSALEGAGKRAAFALFYGPLHFLVTREIVRRLGATATADEILDLGCGSGAAGAAWALEADTRPRLRGVDRARWAVAETRWTWDHFGLRGSVRQGRLEREPLRGAVLLAYAVNELPDAARSLLLDRLAAHTERGGSLLVIEPIARRLVPWWSQWCGRLASPAARTDEWRFALELPEIVGRLDRAAGLDHSELTARSLYRPAQR